MFTDLPRANKRKRFFFKLILAYLLLPEMKKVKADSCSFVPSPTSAHEPHMIIACV
jgi:hypothetical protein